MLNQDLLDQTLGITYGYKNTNSETEGKICYTESST